MAEATVRQTLAAIWHLEAARVIARVARIVADLGVAEECAQDALVAALEHWPSHGIPVNPGAWLMTAAKRRAFDLLRHRRLSAAQNAQLGYQLENEWAAQACDDDSDDLIDDDLLRLIFTACHPLLAAEARCALTLKVVCGLSTAEIARAYFKPEATIAQRIVRAKRSLSVAQIPFEVPCGPELLPRLASVLEVLYLLFNEGYAATSGSDWMRPALCGEAVRVGRVLAGLLPNESEVAGLLALMEIQSSRLAARVSASGEPLLLLDQDRSQWDWQQIQRGLAWLNHAQSLPGPLGPYALQGAIAACHGRATKAEQTDWGQIVALYDLLAELLPSPVVRLNRAVAVGMAFGPAAGLEAVEPLFNDPQLAAYHLLPAVRGDLLLRLDRLAEARHEFERAATLTANGRERALLLARASQCREA